MYRSGLVPRRMTWLGLIGGPLLLIGQIGVLFDWCEPTSAAGLLVAPEFLWGAVAWHLRGRLGIPAGRSDSSARTRERLACVSPRRPRSLGPGPSTRPG